MGYVAIKGGGRAIENAAEVLEFLRTQQGESGQPLSTEQIQKQLYFLHSRIISEGGLYHPQLAALAIKQSLGDTLEASFALRAYRSTKARLLETPTHNTANMRLIRRISASFKDIPGGQMLGPTTDYALRLLRIELLNENPKQFQAIAKSLLQGLPTTAVPDSFPKVLDSLRNEGLLPKINQSARDKPFDITREPLIFPVPRSAALATMARGETGSLLAIAYSNMRGYGDVHPTVAELRVGYLPVMLPHPITGDLIEAGEVLMTECEVVAMYQENDGTANKNTGLPSFSLGYGACFGHNEVKAISMAILDRALQKGMKDGANNPSEDAEFVLLHIDGIDSMGFASHYKMPHYVTFQSDMDRLRTTQNKQASGNHE